MVLAVLGCSLSAGADGDQFTDDELSEFETSINILFTNGITVGCTGTLYCPDDSLTREQMATFIARSLGLGT